jgi:hypothetical protein
MKFIGKECIKFILDMHLTVKISSSVFAGEGLASDELPSPTRFDSQFYYIAS